MSKLPKKGQVVPGSLIALGPKSNKNRLSSSLNPPKRPKVDERLSPSTVVSTLSDSSKNENLSSETMMINFINDIKSSLIVTIKNGKVIPSHAMALFIACKKTPSIFTRPAVLDCLCSILSYTGKDSLNSASGSTFKHQASSNNIAVVSKLKQFHIIITIITFQALRDSNKWPISLMKAYLDDSFGDRNWVDMPECQLLVQNIETGFLSPKIDPKQFQPLCNPSESISNILESIKADNSLNITENWDAFSVLTTGVDLAQNIKPRFDYVKSTVNEMIVSTVKDVLDKRFMQDNQTRSVIRTLRSLAAIPEVRALTVPKLENWLSQSKFQNQVMNLLNIMTSSCYQNISSSQHDVQFAMHLLLKMKYKLYKPNIQSTLLESIKKLIDLHSVNLRHLLNILINAELYGVPNIGTVTNPQMIHNNQQSSGINNNNTTSNSNKQNFNSFAFPVLYMSNPADCIKYLSEFFQEALHNLNGDIKPIRSLLRDLCRCIRTAHLNPHGIYNAFNNNNSLPESLDLLEMTQQLLNVDILRQPDKESDKKLYLENMICLTTDLQLLSVIKPSVKDCLKSKYDCRERRAGANDIEHLRNHYITIRQIRYFTCKWLRRIYREWTLAGDNIPLISNEEMLGLLRQILFLNISRVCNAGVVSGIGDNIQYTITNANDDLAILDIWTNETDRQVLLRGLLEIPLSEKQITTLLSLGVDPHLPYRPTDIIDIIAELIIRASATSHIQGIIPMSINRTGDSIISSLFSSCSYDINAELPPNLAFKSQFWTVCQSLVILAAHCPTACGATLWNNYPTVATLIKMAITNNYQHEVQPDLAILKLETSLLPPNAPEITPQNSRLIDVLIYNLPQGPARLPPLAILDNIRQVFAALNIGDLLAQSRCPDYLLHIVQTMNDYYQSSKTHTHNNRWIIQLVNKSEQITNLPVLCLTEYLLSQLVPTTGSSSGSNIGKLLHNIIEYLHSRIDQHTNLVDNNFTGNCDEELISALALSFIKRLSHKVTTVRSTARSCLDIVLQDRNDPIPNSICEIGSNQFIFSLGALRDFVLSHPDQSSSIIELMSKALSNETNTDLVYRYIEWFYQLFVQHKASFGNPNKYLIDFLGILSKLLLSRPVLTDQLQETNNHKPQLDLYLAELYNRGIQNDSESISAEILDSIVFLLSWGWSNLTEYLLNHIVVDGELIDGCDLSQQWIVDNAVASGCKELMNGVLRHCYKVHGVFKHSLDGIFLNIDDRDYCNSWIGLIDSLLMDQSGVIEQWISNDLSKQDKQQLIEELQADKFQGPFIKLLKTSLEKCNENNEIEDNKIQENDVEMKDSLRNIFSINFVNGVEMKYLSDMKVGFNISKKHKETDNQMQVDDVPKDDEIRDVMYNLIVEEYVVSDTNDLDQILRLKLDSSLASIQLIFGRSGSYSAPKYKENIVNSLISDIPLIVQREMVKTVLQLPQYTLDTLVASRLLDFIAGVLLDRMSCRAPVKHVSKPHLNRLNPIELSWEEHKNLFYLIYLEARGLGTHQLIDRLNQRYRELLINYLLVDHNKPYCDKLINNFVDLVCSKSPRNFSEIVCAVLYCILPCGYAITGGYANTVVNDGLAKSGMLFAGHVLDNSFLDSTVELMLQTIVSPDWKLAQETALPLLRILNGRGALLTASLIRSLYAPIRSCQNTLDSEYERHVTSVLKKRAYQALMSMLRLLIDHLTVNSCASVSQDSQVQRLVQLLQHISTIELSISPTEQNSLVNRIKCVLSKLDCDLIDENGDADDNSNNESVLSSANYRYYYSASDCARVNSKTQLDLLVNYKLRHCSNVADDDATKHAIAELDDITRRDCSATSMMGSIITQKLWTRSVKQINSTSTTNGSSNALSAATITSCTGNNNSDSNSEFNLLLRVVSRHLTQFPKDSYNFYSFVVNPLLENVTLMGSSSVASYQDNFVNINDRVIQTVAQTSILAPEQVAQALKLIARAMITGKCQWRETQLLLDSIYTELSMERIVDNSAKIVENDLTKIVTEHNCRNPFLIHQHYVAQSGNNNYNKNNYGSNNNSNSSSSLNHINRKRHNFDTNDSIGVSDQPIANNNKYKRAKVT